MKRFIMVNLLPAGLVNLGNLFAYLFQLLIIRSLSVPDVGAVSAIFALTNVFAAPAAVLPFGIARIIIATRSINGAVGNIIARSAIWGLLLSGAILALGLLLIEPLRATLRIDQTTTTTTLTLLILCTTLLSGLTIGWLQGALKYVSASLAIAGIPVLRFAFGTLLISIWGASIDTAVMAIALPGAVVFAAGLAYATPLILRRSRASLPKRTWQEFGRFMISSSVSSLLLLGFWNLDVVTVRAMFSAEASGIYAAAAVLGRIPYLLSVAVANTLFAEALRPGTDGPDSERAARRVLMLHFVIAGMLGVAAAIPLWFFAEPVLIAFGGLPFAASASILRALVFAMALLALLQIVATYMLARYRHEVLWVLGAALAGFLGLSHLFANSPLGVAYYLMGAIMIALIACLIFVFIRPARHSTNIGLASRDVGRGGSLTG